MVDKEKIRELEKRIEILEKAVRHLVGGRMDDKMRSSAGISERPY